MPLLASADGELGMAASRSAGPRAVHLSHTTVAGGAELALKRLLAADPDWYATVLVPVEGDENVFADVTPRSARGVRQPSGGSDGGRLRKIDLGARLVVQAAVTRWHRAVRGSDVVVANATRSAAYGALAVLGTRRPFVVHLRDHITSEALGGFGHRMMTRFVLPRADGVVANSRSTLETAVPFLRADAVSAVIPSPSGLGRLRDMPRPDGGFRVGMLARLDPWKGQLELLEAFAEAFPDGDEQLDLPGAALFEHAAFEAQLRRRARDLGIADRVNLLGHVDDIAPLLASWDVAVQYSLRAEPMGQNVLQYLAAGAAVVVADEGGPAEWVQHERNGLRVPPRDRAALAAVLRRLAADRPLRESLGSAARCTPGLRDDTEIAALHGALYREVIAARAARPGAAARGRARLVAAGLG